MPPDEASRSGSTRARPTWLLIAAAALFVARVGTGLYEERHPASSADMVSWQPIEGAEARAQREHRAVLYDFTADWCPPCQAMRQEVFSDAEAAREIDRMYVAVRVLDRQREEGHNPPLVDSLQKRFQIDSFPTLVIVPSDGRAPIVTAGYPGRQQTIQELRSAAIQGILPFPPIRPPGPAGGR
jgi:thiol:disulfide interchange protein